MKVEEKSYHGQNTPSEVKEKSHVSSEDVKLFEQVKNEEKDPKKHFEDKNSNASSQNDLSSIFSSLLNPALNQDKASSINIQQPQDNSIESQDLSKLANELVEKILVSDPKYTSGSEVRLTLGQNSGLSGTEIILRRDLDGLLSVVINAHNQDQFKKLVSVRNDLNRALEKHESSRLRLEINDPENNEEAITDSSLNGPNPFSS